MSIDLTKHLWPKGRSLVEPNLMPNVLDSDGNTVAFTSPKRKTSEATVVNLGDSPNSNNGDPLRVAFAKINNFMEASYWANEGLVQRFNEIDSEFTQGFFVYSDSDERYNISLKENSGLRLNGKENQIEISVRSQRTSNVGEDFDSEVWITFQFPETVDISTLRVSENATFDSDVNITGQLTVGQQALFEDGIQVQGHAQFDSDVHVLGSARFDSEMSVGGVATFDSELNAMGAFNSFGVATFDSEVVMNSTLDVAGKATFDSEVAITGALSVTGVATFDSEVTLKSSLVVTGKATFDSEIVVAGTVSAAGFTAADPAAPMVFTSPVQFDSEVVFNETVTLPDVPDLNNLMLQHDSDIRAHDSDIDWLYEKVGEGTEYVLAALDSDVAILTANQDSEHALMMSMFIDAEAKLDSDVAILTLNQDSDYRHYMDLHYLVMQRADSESIKVQQLKTNFEDIIMDNPIVLDADRPTLQGKVPITNSIARFDKSVMPLDVPLFVNGIQPDLNQNIVINITATGIGARDDRADSEVDGFVFIVDNTDSDSGTANDASGTLYIYSDDARAWQRIVGFTAAENDIRYVNVTGDTMVGPLYLAADPVALTEGTTKHYVDSLDSDISDRITDNDSDILYLQTLIDGGTF